MCPARAATTLALFLALVPGSLQLTITEFEVPAAIELGEDAELRCKYELTAESAGVFVKWWVTPSNTGGDRKQLYQRHAGGQAVALQHNIVIKGEDDTVILSTVTANDSGVYECEVSDIDEVRRHQQLTVFTQGSGPAVNVSEIPDGEDDDTVEDVLVECRADNVAPAPDIMLTINGEEYNMSESVTGPDQDGLYDISGNVTFSKDDVDGAEFRCELFFLDTAIKHPLYVDTELYNPSGELSTTEAAEEDVEVDPTTHPLTESQSGNSAQSRMSLALLVAAAAAAAALAQLHALL